MNPDKYSIASYRAQEVANHLRNAHERKTWSTLDVHGYAESRAIEALALLAAEMGFQLTQIKPPAAALVSDTYQDGLTNCVTSAPGFDGRNSDLATEPAGHIVWTR
jgi:hypothetical protein